jgi:hypothetical protein
MEAAQVGPINITLRRKIFGKTCFFPVLEVWLRNRAAGARKAGRQAAIFGLRETDPDSPNRSIPHSSTAAVPRPDRWLTAHRGVPSRGAGDCHEGLRDVRQEGRGGANQAMRRL